MTKTKTVAAPTADPGPERELARLGDDTPPVAESARAHPETPIDAPAAWPSGGVSVVVSVCNDLDARHNVVKFKLTLTAEMSAESLKAANAVCDELFADAHRRTVAALEEFVPSLAHDDEFKNLQKQRALFQSTLGERADSEGRAAALPEQIRQLLSQGDDPAVLENELATVQQRLTALSTRLPIVKKNLEGASQRWDSDVRALLREKYDELATAADRQFEIAGAAVAAHVLELFRVLQMAHATLAGVDVLRVADLATLLQARGIAIPCVESVAPANPLASKVVMVNL